jgi:hypothetical protein
MGPDTVDTWISSGIALLAADNLSVEPRPTNFAIHIGAMRNHGVVMGELWDLETLARRCHETSRYEFLLVSVPLNLVGAFGSPANAIAVL